MDRDFKKRDGDEHVVDLLSAYIDNALNPGERESVRAHIETCASCQADHETLLGTQFMLRSLPVVPPPRAFTLTPEMVGAGARRESFWQRLLTPRAVPRFATGSVVAFALLALLLVGDLAVVRQNGIFTPYATTSRQLAPAQDTGAERNAGIAAVQADSTATTGAAGSDDTTLALAQPTAPTLPPNAGGATEPTTAAAERGITAPGGTPEPTALALMTNQSKAFGTPDALAMKQPGLDPYADFGYVPPEERRNSTVPILELALAAVGTALAIFALVARRRGV